MASMKDYQERDFVGYADELPKVEWPHGARLALNISLAVEEGGECCVVHGDDTCHPTGIDSLTASPHVRDLDIESAWEYGSRVGFWRLIDIFSEYEVKVSCFCVGKALEMNPERAQAITAHGHEAVDEGYRYGDCWNLENKSKDEERAMHLRSMEVVRGLTGQVPVGHVARSSTLQTRELLAELGYLYDSGWIVGELPIFVSVKGKPLLLVPYSRTLNDGRYWRSNGYVEPNQFLREAKAWFDCLYKESSRVPKMMTFAVHPRSSGLPGRANAVERFIAHARAFPGVWFARRDEIARVWWEQFGPKTH